MNKKVLSFCLLMLCACGNRSEGDSNRSDSKIFTVEGNRIAVAAGSPLLSAIKLQPVEEADYRTSFSASGEVRPLPSKYAEIASPFAGRITRSFVHLGQRVAAGSPIFEITSPAFFEARKAYSQARHEMELALKTLNRERDLLAHHAVAAKDVEEAETVYQLKKEDCEQALAALKVYQLAAGSDSTGGLIVRSPISGEVVRNNVVVGQYIREDADAPALVADLDKVWVVAHVKEKDIPQLHSVDTVRIELSALPGAPVEGQIRYVSRLLDESTRSVDVVVECDNRNRQIRPFMYGTVRFAASPARAAAVPSSAILQDEDEHYIILNENPANASPNTFRKAKITIASVEGDRTFILSGVGAGEQAVVEGAIYFIDAR